MPLKPSCSACKDGKASLLPQEAGILPDNGIPYRMRVDKAGKAPAAQASGRHPALATALLSHRNNNYNNKQCVLHNNGCSHHC